MTTPRPRLLDLFAGAGGAAMGYHRAGWDVVGVDIRPQPNYPFEFHEADALEVLRHRARAWGMPSISGFDAIHASPPCQAYLCGTSFGLGADGFEHRRHRYFEASFPMLVPNCHHSLPAAPLYGHNPGRDWRRRYGRTFTIDLKREAMGIGWMNRNELAEAIPPAMTEFIGAELLRQLASPTLAPAGANE